MSEKLVKKHHKCPSRSTINSAVIAMSAYVGVAYACTWWETANRTKFWICGASIPIPSTDQREICHRSWKTESWQTSLPKFIWISVTSFHSWGTKKLQYDQFWYMHFRGWAPIQLTNATVHPHQWGKPENQPLSNLHNNVSSWLILLTARIKSASSLGNNFHIFHHRNQVSSSSGSFSFHYCNQHTVSVRDIGLHTDTLTMYNKYQLLADGPAWQAASSALCCR